MSDEELICSGCGEYVGSHISDRIEALNEQLEAARADAKEAEAYAEGLERDLKTCCMAQVVMDNTVAELERERDEWKASWQEVLTAGYEIKAKLAKAVEALRYYAVEAMPWEADDSLTARETLAEIEGHQP
jgi:chromosome segregation ATPase